MLTILLTIIIVGLINWYSHHGMAVARDNILRVRGLETVPDTTKVHKTIIVMLANLGNQTALRLFAMCRLNYNHFQTGRTATESWSWSVRGTRCLRTTPGTHAYRNFSQNGRSKSRFSNFKVILNSIATTDSLLIYLTQCTWLSTFIKSAKISIIAISVT